MPSQNTVKGAKHDVLSVSRLNAEVRAVLEGSFPLIWVEGEISNLARPASGHIYFSLKDAQAQVRCAMFRMRRQRLRFQPENGQQVLLRARVGLYEARGDFQLLVEHMEPSGEGALIQAFEALKRKLADAGLFDGRWKQELPPFPRRVGLITSPSGAAVRDVLSVLRRRFPAIPVVIYPVPVQGSEAPEAISRMIALADRRRECDLLILTRGGGSLEDLAAFNDEAVARAIHAAETPIVSAVGHEIDFTIADFVADRRAPTPSAAAEMCSPDGAELAHKLSVLAHRLGQRMHHRIESASTRLGHLQQRLQRQHPGQRIMQRQQRLDELTQRLATAIGHRIRHSADRLARLQSRLEAGTPQHKLQRLEQQRRLLSQRLRHAMSDRLQQRRQYLATAAANLHALSPLATLDRGYSVTRALPGKKVLHSSTDAAPGDRVETLLARGALLCLVEQITASDTDST